MIPKKGGTPLADSPICLPGEHAAAGAYVLTLQAALGQAGWSSSQRGRIRALIRLWMYRSEGRDPHFEQYGSFGRKPGTQPPTEVDAVVARWRRLSPQDAEARKRRRGTWRMREMARERDRYGK